MKKEEEKKQLCNQERDFRGHFRQFIDPLRAMTEESVTMTEEVTRLSAIQLYKKFGLKVEGTQGQGKTIRDRMVISWSDDQNESIYQEEA